MKKAKNYVITLGLLVMLIGCGSKTETTPTKNQALIDITSTKKVKKDYAMQKALDNWLENEWTPTIEKNESIKKINDDKERAFTLQEYVEKISAYRGKTNDINASHAKELRNIPVIGERK